MSLQIPITSKEINALGRHLAKPYDFVCLDHHTYIKALLVGQQRLIQGKPVRAKIIKGFEQGG